MKRKIMAIGVILLLVAIPFSIAQAEEINEDQNNETISIEIVAFESDEVIIAETAILSEEELVELENTISSIMDAIQSASTWEEFENIIENLPVTSGIIKSIITSIISKFSIFRSRAFVISSGHSYKFNPFKKSSLKIRQTFTFWRYTNGEIGQDRTIYIQPLALKMKILKGIQFGYMYKFTGIHIYVARKLPEKSYTFFTGTAKRMNGIQLSPN